ncbi:MAG: hypothetical protein ABI905_08090 [Betaproteobacteria bacterium]
MDDRTLKIELRGCSESLDLLDNQDELQRVLAWVLMMNRLDPTSGCDAAIESHLDDASLSVQVNCARAPAGEGANEKNVRNAVADLLGLFDPADHVVTTVSNTDADHAHLDTVPLWPKDANSHRYAHAGRHR